MDLWTKLQKSNKPIVLYGMGNGADRILDIMAQKGIKASGVFASDGFVRHQSFRGFIVSSYGELKEKYGEMIVLLSFGTHRPEVIEQVKRIKNEQELYAPDVPVAGDTIFDRSFAECHRDDFKRVYEMLSDDLSRYIFKNIVYAKLSGELPYLFDCESSPENAWDLLDLSDHETYLDLGAYTGDTVSEFVHYKQGKYDKIIAVEPDRKNYSKLCINTASFHNCECINACADEVTGFKNYAMDGGRKSHALQIGGISVPAVRVDDLKDRISFIKMDVEGMEAAVLRGAAETIRNMGPSMQVAAYHRSEDLFALPLLIEAIRPGAQLFIRHFPCLPAWDTNFYFKFL